ncbi:MAG TPA: DUF2892 domain-containing protein [Balneolaceae bacterium]|nr:DUF2892 domain-containing protein [Balneolaceae bacterium]
MQKNMSVADRSIRTIVAIIFFILYATGVVTGVLGIILLILAAVFILTSLIGYCPLYAPFGIRTLKKGPGGEMT